jgi:hypothetical protein
MRQITIEKQHNGNIHLRVSGVLKLSWETWAEKLEGVNPNQVTQIDVKGTQVVHRRAFWPFRNVRRVYFNDSIQVLNEGCFWRCYQLQEIGLPLKNLKAVQLNAIFEFERQLCPRESSRTQGQFRWESQDKWVYNPTYGFEGDEKNRARKNLTFNHGEVDSMKKVLDQTTFSELNAFHRTFQMKVGGHFNARITVPPQGASNVLIVHDDPVFQSGTIGRFTSGPPQVKIDCEQSEKKGKGLTVRCEGTRSQVKGWGNPSEKTLHDLIKPQLPTTADIKSVMVRIHQDPEEEDPTPSERVSDMKNTTLRQFILDVVRGKIDPRDEIEVNLYAVDVDVDV